MTGLYIVYACGTWYYMLCLKWPDEWDLKCWNELNSWNATEWNWWQRECWKSVFLCLFIYIYNFNRKGGGGHREEMTMNSLKIHNEQWPSRQSFDLPIPSNSQRISGILWEFVILGVLSHIMTLSCRCSLLTAYDLPLERSRPWLEADFREDGIVTSDRCDNFLLFISLRNIRKGISRHIRIYAYI